MSEQSTIREQSELPLPRPSSRPPIRFSDPEEAFYRARRAIVNNALRRGQSSLDLSSYGLTTLPPEIGSVASLRDLDLKNNYLATLPPEIGQMRALQRLNISTNQLV